MPFFETKMKCHFFYGCVLSFCFLYYISARFSYLGFRPFFFIHILQKKYFCFFPHSLQHQMNSFRISGVHGILLSQIIPLQYTTLGTECQVRIMLILFYYFSQHFITIFVQHLVAIFLHVLRDIYKGRNSLRKCNLNVQNLCLIRHSTVIFLAYFYTQSINYPIISYHTSYFLSS